MVSLLFKIRLFIVKCQVGARYECQRAQQGELPLQVMRRRPWKGEQKWVVKEKAGP